jgi:hypothetical protein
MKTRKSLQSLRRRNIPIDHQRIRICIYRKISRLQNISLLLFVVITLFLTTLLRRRQYSITVNWDTTTIDISSIVIPIQSQQSKFHNVPASRSSDDDIDDILILWDHWTYLEQIVDSIWSGNLFCSTIEQRLDQYYNETTRKETVNTPLTFPHSLQRTISKHDHILPLPKLHVQIELSCYDLFQQSKHGTGNYIQIVYMMRLAVKYISNAKIKLNITCFDHNIKELYTNYLFPWFTGVWYSPNYYNDENHKTTMTTNSLIQTIDSTLYCGEFRKIPTALLYQEMQYDVRRMVIALVGNQPNLPKETMDDHRISTIKQFMKDHIYIKENSFYNYFFNHKKTKRERRGVYLSPENLQERISSNTKILPLIKQPIEFDDAVIHFRCGDLLSTKLKSYGFMTFHGYSRHIHASVRTIGILTQPFGSFSSSSSSTSNSTTIVTNDEETNDQKRSLDTGNIQQAQRCRTLVYAFVEFLQNTFPKASIRIRNDRSETIALAYARMVMANQVVASMSTFGIFPTICTFGTGYYLHPRPNDPSIWLMNKVSPITKVQNSNVVIFDEINLKVGLETRNLWDAYGDDIVLQWFRTGQYTVDESILYNNTTTNNTTLVSI